MLIFHPTYAYRENLRVLMKETAFRRNQEKNRGQIEPRTSQREAARDTRPCMKTARPCCRTRRSPARRTVSRTAVRETVRPRTAVPCVRTAVRGRRRARLNPFSRGFLGHLSFCLFFLVFPLCSRVRERLERVLKHLD
uniref:Uncharacterized protein n=1 Tax=Opuntia streptacantha TaxID=393608 RepID=A0A7C9A0X8_OPUST